MAISKSNVVANELPSIATRTIDDVRNYFRLSGANTEKSVTNMIDLGRAVVESAAPVNGSKGKPAITAKKDIAMLYGDFQSGRKAASVGKFDASDEKAKTAAKKQIEKLEACFNFATGKHAAHAVRVANDAYQLLLGDTNTGEAGLGGRVYTSFVSVARQHVGDKLDAPMTRPEIKAFLEGDTKDTTKYVYDVLKKIDDAMARESGLVKSSKPTMALPKDALTALAAARIEIAPVMAAALTVKTTAQAMMKEKATKAALAATVTARKGK